MMKKLALMTAFALSQAIAAPAQVQPGAMNQGQMDRLDRDGNGAVDQAEYQAFKASAFATLDKNKDGNLSSEEVAQVLNAQQFAATDGNRDGKLSRNEFLSKVMADFKAADRSGDGSLQ